MQKVLPAVCFDFLTDNKVLGLKCIYEMDNGRAIYSESVSQIRLHQSWVLGDNDKGRELCRRYVKIRSYPGVVTLGDCLCAAKMISDKISNIHMGIICKIG